MLWEPPIETNNGNPQDSESITKAQQTPRVLDHNDNSDHFIINNGHNPGETQTHFSNVNDSIQQIEMGNLRKAAQTNMLLAFNLNVPLVSACFL